MKPYLGTDFFPGENHCCMVSTIVKKNAFFQSFEVAFLGQIALCKNKNFGNGRARCANEVALYERFGQSRGFPSEGCKVA